MERSLSTGPAWQSSVINIATTPRSEYKPAGAEVFQRMSALAAAHGAVNFSQGIPAPVYDDLWRDALTNHASSGGLQYVPSAGVAPLREVVAAQHGVAVEDVVITSGCTESLAAILQAAASHGVSKVVWTEPFYSFYPGMATAAGLAAQCVPLTAKKDIPEFDVAALAEVVQGPERCVLLINSPHNPTGAVVTSKQWSQLVDLAVETDSVLVVDDAYRDFIYDGCHTPYQELLAHENMLVAGSVSKTAAATGARVGWVLTSAKWRSMIDDAHMHMSYCAPDFVQRAAADVLAEVWSNKADPCIAAQVACDYADRGDALMEDLAAVGATVHRPLGGFFVTCEMPPSVGPAGADGEKLAKWFTTEHGITPLPLDVFFARQQQSTSLRFSFTVSGAEFDRGRKALQRLGSAS